MSNKISKKIEKLNEIVRSRSISEKRKKRIERTIDQILFEDEVIHSINVLYHGTKDKKLKKYSDAYLQNKILDRVEKHLRKKS